MKHPSSNRIKKLSGQCLCGTIAYEINGDLGPIVNCHCTKCPRWHGAAFRTRTTVETKNFKWVKGKEHLSKYSSSEHVCKTFCSICGSSLISTYDDAPDYIGLPQYEEWPPFDLNAFEIEKENK